MASRTRPATPYPKLNAVVEEFVAGARSSLGEQFVGAYLQGSFAVGDFDEHSDVDFIVVSEAEPDPSRVDALQTMHDRLYDLGSEWARHLEGSYFPREVLLRLSCRGADLWYLDNGARRLVRSDHCNTLVVRRVLRDTGITLSGPPLDTLIEPIPEDLLAREMYETMIQWGRAILRGPDGFRNNFYQGYIVLNFCRMLHDLRRRRPGSKRAGAEWARRTLDPSWTDLIDSAWSTRPDPARSVRTPANAEAFERTLRFVEYVLQVVESVPPTTPRQDS